MHSQGHLTWAVDAGVLPQLNILFQTQPAQLFMAPLSIILEKF